ncbi:HlyD family secretion protein [Radicibacter daui]|uniref:HlyD family secretion protein n=1 Tax=Radicibacter daui TaxID=3064829 RepID=UPI0040469BCC
MSAGTEGAAEIGAGARRRLPLKKLLMGAILIAALAGGGLYGKEWWQTGRFLEETDDAYVGADVTVIAPRIAGFIDQVLVTDNQHVRAGDLLVRLDGRDLAAALAKADAAVEAAEAALGNLDASYRLQQSSIAETEAAQVATQAETARAKLDYSRYTRLSGSQYVSDQRLQQARADYQKAVAAEDKAGATVEAANRQLAVLETRRKQLAASLDQAIAERDIARLNLSYTEIRAPVDGVIGNRSARDGAYATAGAALLSVVPSEGLWIDANFKESQLAELKPGQKAEIRADILPGQIFTGHVESVAPATGAEFSVLPPENATGNFTKIVQRVPVRIRLEGAAARLGALRPGLSVTAEVDVRGGDSAPLAGSFEPATNVAEATLGKSAEQLP